MTVEYGECHCGNISAEVTLTRSLSEYTPRACDCDFCIKNGAAYMSDPQGELNIKINRPKDATFYQQGDKLVYLLICRVCGVLAAVTYGNDGNRLAGLNSKVLLNRDSLAPTQVASPKLLSSSEKVKRWSEIWFSRVKIDYG